MKKAMIRFANRVDLILLLFGVHCSVRSSTPHHADDYLCPNLLPQILFFIFDEYETKLLWLFIRFRGSAHVGAAIFPVLPWCSSKFLKNGDQQFRYQLLT